MKLENIQFQLQTIRLSREQLIRRLTTLKRDGYDVKILEQKLKIVE